MRTTSSVESLNASLGKSFPKRGNVFEFINSLKLFEFAKTSNMRNLTKSVPKNQLKRRRTIKRKIDDMIKYYENLRLNNAITVSEFLVAMTVGKILPLEGIWTQLFLIIFFINCIHFSDVKQLLQKEVEPELRRSKRNV